MNLKEKKTRFKSLIKYFFLNEINLDIDVKKFQISKFCISEYKFYIFHKIPTDLLWQRRNEYI